MLPHIELIIRLLIAAGLGSLVGAERERLLWAAGLRTHMLVCVGSCLVMIVSAYGFEAVIKSGVVLDPSRVAAQVVSGIGFLGAGSILLRGDLIKGLTTAASLWTVAGIGLAVGGGLYTEAVAATLIILVILAGVKPLERWYQQRQGTLNLALSADRGKVSLELVCKTLGLDADRITRFTYGRSQRNVDDIELTIKRVSSAEREAIVSKLNSLSAVRIAKRL